MASTTQRPIFSDDLIKATELNRTPGQVLDRASVAPVTIARNDEFFTLIRRDEISEIVSDADRTKRLLEMLGAAFLARFQPEKIDATHPLSWLRAFESGEIEEFVTEVMEAYRKAELSSEYWVEVDAVIHEWHESVIAVFSEDLDEPWKAPADETPLTEPSAAVGRL